MIAPGETDPDLVGYWPGDIAGEFFFIVRGFVPGPDGTFKFLGWFGGDNIQGSGDRVLAEQD